MQNNIDISIVIPIKNGSFWLKETLTAITKQTLFSRTEIIIIDSGSTDSSIEICIKFPVRLIQIQSKEFNHGTTRQLGVKHALGKFVVMTVQDAIPADRYWLENMVKHFDDPMVAGVCGQQIVPHEKDKNPHEWFRPQHMPTIKTAYFPNKEHFLQLSPLEKRSACGWDDVTAMYRKSVLSAFPFKPVMFAEDLLWAKEALLNGYKLVYDNTARVYHYHAHNPSFTYNRTLTELYHFWKIFGLVRAKPYSFKNYMLVVYRNFKWRANLKWIFYNWQMIFYTNKAANDFNNAIKKGKAEALYQKKCEIIPLANQY